MVGSLETVSYSLEQSTKKKKGARINLEYAIFSEGLFWSTVGMVYRTHVKEANCRVNVSNKSRFEWFLKIIDARYPQ